MKISLRKLIRYVAAIGPAILRLAGVKSKTVAAKAVDVVVEADKILPPPKP